ncbi:MAG: hemagluttinin repeat-containing protein [Chlorobi bacterium OLB5]|nr:MAG: hemagluttinin repeat-containing protein [Chlorobi bacterium OLB5]
MKTIIILLFLSLNFTIVWGQNPDFDENYTSGYGYIPEPSPYMISGNWSILPNSPNSLSRSCCAYVEINGIPYLYQFGGGNSTAELRRVSRLNLSNGTWNYNYSTMPYQISSGTAVPINGGSEILVFGGNSPTFGKTLKYNVGANSWQTLSDMSTRITDALIVKHSESHIFIIGGGDGYYGASALKTNKVQVYNVASNTYTYSNDLPIPITMLGGGLYRDTIITAGGYTTNGVAIANCYKGVVNPSNLSVTWTQIQNYPAGPITRMASFVAVKGTGVGIMCTGGAIGGSVPTSLTHFWNFCTQSWQPGLPDNTLARSNYKACGKGYDIVYAVGGYTTNTNSNRTESLIYTHIDGPCQNMVSINSNNNTIPLIYELKQNYPNPFNPQTRINFSVPRQSNVNIFLTDAKGQQVKLLANSIFPTGNYSVSLNAEDLSSGIYFYTMISDGFKETRKMLLIK